MKTAAKPNRLAWIWQQMVNKYLGIEERFVWLIGAIRPRLVRLGKHLLNAFRSKPTYYKDSKIGWWGELGVYLLELFALPEIYESISSFLKYNTRPLTDHEMAVGLSIFGESLDFDLVRVDNRAYLGPKQRHFAYVSFHTVNSWGDISDAHFIHELMHIWQYERMGAMYIPRSLAAQKTEMGYNYGGVEALAAHRHEGLDAFNLEQQADIIADYYRLSHDLPPKWGNATREDLPIYETYIKELKIK